MPDVIDIAATIGELVLALAGLLLAANVRAHIRTRVAERRIEAYARLWARMRAASPTRLQHEDRPLTQAEMKALYDDFVDWYYRKGNGLFLGGSTRTLFNRVKDNLIAAKDDFVPKQSDADIDPGRHLIYQLSLLRAWMRADVAVYGSLYFKRLTTDQKALLEACGISWWETYRRLRVLPWQRPVDTLDEV